MFASLVLVCALAAPPCEIECPCAEHPETAIVTVPVPEKCPHKSGDCEATVYDYTTAPPKGSKDKPEVRHLLKSVSPCGCVVKVAVCACIPDGKYPGKCTAAEDGKSSSCVYEIKCKADKKS